MVWWVAVGDDRGWIPARIGVRGILRGNDGVDMPSICMV